MDCLFTLRKFWTHPTLKEIKSTSLQYNTYIHVSMSKLSFLSLAFIVFLTPSMTFFVLFLFLMTSMWDCKMKLSSG